MGYRWGPEGPPDEAYSRVTNPERFGPLHEWVVDLLERLEARFDVVRTEAFGLDPELEGVRPPVRPSIRLQPRGVESAPITVVFTDFPGLLARFGRWHQEGYPHCGCDACDETAESAWDDLTSTVEQVTEGQFSEIIREADVRKSFDEYDSWLEFDLWAQGGGQSGRTLISAADARDKVGTAGRTSFSWKPWRSL